MSQDPPAARIAKVDPARERRRSARHEVDLEAQVREMGSEGVEARLIDVSDHGFCVQCDEGEFDIGMRIWLIVPDRERASAMIKWVAADRIGAEFFEPVDIAALVGRKA